MSDPFMTIDLRQINTGQTGASTRRTDNSSDTNKASDSTLSAKNASSQDSVELSSKSQLVSSLITELSTKPEVDSSRVEQLKSSIASGEYSVSADKIASKLLTLDFGLRNLS